jgi:hypothetical protein
LGGLFGPILALVGTVGLLYALTRQLPAIVEVTRGEGDRHSAITLASQAEARASWVRFVGDLRAAMLELEAHKGSALRS